MPDNHTYDFCQEYQEFDLKTKDGAKLNAVHIRQDSARGVVLYFHGNSGNISHLNHVANIIEQKGYDAILIDYRTYGKSTGKLSEEALKKDAQLFYNHALTKYNEKNIILYGRSFGTGIASGLAAENAPRKLILESPFYSAVSLGQHRFPILPVSLLSEFRFPSNEYLQKVNCPIYIFHGTEDSVIPYKFAKKLYEDIPETTKKKLYTVEGAGHNYLQDFDAFKVGMSEAFE
jgi:alpha-beta hydrolase superfamily lysophospholipase